MKKIALIIFSLVLSAGIYAQQPTNLAMSIIVEDIPEEFPTTAKINIVSKINRAMTAHGIASTNTLNRFFITVVATPLTKDVIPGNPMRIAQNIEFTFYIADYVSQTTFSSITLNAKGVGTNDTKSYMNAISNMNFNQEKFSEFVGKGIDKIIEYYDTNAQKIIGKANLLAKQHEYGEAMFMLIDIPFDCKQYDNYTNAALSIYQQYVDYQCDQNLIKARTEWLPLQNAEGAQAAGEYLSQIYPEAKCYGEAMSLYNEIKDKVHEDWNFTMRQYDDSVDLKEQAIKAIRDVGVAYGEGQQPTTTNLSWLGR